MISKLDAYDFNKKMKSLSSKESSLLFEEMKNQNEFPRLIKRWWHTGSGGFSYVMEALSFEQRAIVFEATKKELPELITTTSSVNYILQVLSPAQCKIALELIERQLSKVIRNDDDIKEVLNGLSDEKQSIVRETMEKITELKLQQQQKQSSFFSFFKSTSASTKAQDSIPNTKTVEDDRDYPQTWCERILTCFY